MGLLYNAIIAILIVVGILIVSCICFVLYISIVADMGDKYDHDDERNDYDTSRPVNDLEDL
jgi:hypothetical protein